MKETITTDGVITSFRGRVFIYDNSNSRYAIFGRNQPDPSWTKINGLNGRRVLYGEGNGDSWLFKLSDDKLLLFSKRTNQSVSAKIYNNQNVEEILTSLDGRISFLERDSDDDILLGTLPLFVDGDNKEYNIWNEAKKGPYLSMGFKNGIGRWDICNGYVAISENESTDVVIMRTDDYRNQCALTIGGKIGQQICNIENSMRNNGYDLDYIENGKLILRRALSWALPSHIGFLGSPYDIEHGITNPKEYFDNLQYHHPETNLDDLWLIENDDSGVDMLTFARDSHIFVHSVWADSNGDIQYRRRLKLLSEAGMIRTATMDYSRDLLYLAGDGGAMFCLNRKDWARGYSYDYGNKDYCMSTFDMYNHRYAVLDTKGTIKVFDTDNTGVKLIPKTIIITGRKMPTSQDDDEMNWIASIRLVGNAVYVWGSDWSITKHTF